MYVLYVNKTSSMKGTRLTSLPRYDTLLKKFLLQTLVEGNIFIIAFCLICLCNWAVYVWLK